MKDNTPEELIDDFLKGKISDEDRNHLEGRMKADHELARQVRESREAFRFLQYLRYQQIKKQLREFDEMETLRVTCPHARRGILTTILILISILCGWIWMINHYKPENLAKRNFENIAAADLIPEAKLNSDIQNWNTANELFAKGDYKNAASLYMVIAENPQSPYYFKARWNVLMCQLAADGPTYDFRNELDQFKSLSSNPLKPSAIRLSRLLDSKFYKWAILKPSSHFSALKPRLI